MRSVGIDLNAARAQIKRPGTSAEIRFAPFSAKNAHSSNKLFSPVGKNNFFDANDNNESKPPFFVVGEQQGKVINKNQIADPNSAPNPNALVTEPSSWHTPHR